MKRSIVLAIAATTALVVANASPVASGTTPASFDLKETSDSYTIGADSQSVNIPIAYVKGETVTVSHSGSVTTPVSAAAASGSYLWNPDAGGVWTLSDDGEGTVEFRVHYSLFGIGDTGTAEKPAKVMDADDFAETVALLDTSAKDGFTFAIDEECPSATGFVRPSGYAVLDLGDGVYSLAESSDGRIAGSSWGVYAVDTRKPGPNRTVKSWSELLPFAYSGDGWSRANVTAASTLTFSPQSGEATSESFTGEGAYSYAMPENGSKVWTVTLTGDGIDTLTSRINLSEGITIIVF